MVAVRHKHTNRYTGHAPYEQAMSDKAAAPAGAPTVLSQVLDVTTLLDSHAVLSAEALIVLPRPVRVDFSLFKLPDPSNSFLVNP